MKMRRDISEPCHSEIGEIEPCGFKRADRRGVFNRRTGDEIRIACGASGGDIRFDAVWRPGLRQGADAPAEELRIPRELLDHPYSASLTKYNGRRCTSR